MWSTLEIGKHAGRSWRGKLATADRRGIGDEDVAVAVVAEHLALLFVDDDRLQSAVDRLPLDLGNEKSWCQPSISPMLRPSPTLARKDFGLNRRFAGAAALPRSCRAPDTLC